MTSPHLCPCGPFMLAGSVGQSGTRRYGFGSADGLGGRVSLPSWAYAITASAATTTAPVTSSEPERHAGDLLDLHRQLQAEHRRRPSRTARGTKHTVST